MLPPAICGTGWIFNSQFMRENATGGGGDCWKTAGNCGNCRNCEIAEIGEIAGIHPSPYAHAKLAPGNSS